MKNSRGTQRAVSEASRLLAEALLADVQTLEVKLDMLKPGLLAEREVRHCVRAISLTFVILGKGPFATNSPEFNATLKWSFVHGKVRAWYRRNGPAREAEARGVKRV